jgi:TATA-binding protein-associated factor Taf7
MNSIKRNGNRWNVNELLSLEREYELLEWTVHQIAEKHQRTVRAILFRLESEGIISSWNDARGFDMEEYKASIEDDVVTEDCVCNEESCVNDDDEEEHCGGDDNDSEYFGEEDDDDEDDDEDDNDDDDESQCDEEYEPDDASEVEKLSDRVWSLETAVTDIKDMVQQLFNKLVLTNEKKPKPLRKQSFEN